MIPADLHARVRQEQEKSGKTLSEFVEQLITDYYTNIFLKRLMIYRRCCIMKMVMRNEKIHFHA